MDPAYLSKSAQNIRLEDAGSSSEKPPSFITNLMSFFSSESEQHSNLEQGRVTLISLERDNLKAEYNPEITDEELKEKGIQAESPVLKLDLHDCKKLSNPISALVHFPHLVSLNLANTAAFNDQNMQEMASNLPKLKFLNLEKSQVPRITYFALTEIAKLGQLRKLNISRLGPFPWNEIKKLFSLKNLTHLKISQSYYFSQKKFEKLVEGMPQLQALEIDMKEGVNIEPLVRLAKLVKVRLKIFGEDIVSEDFLTPLNKAPHLSILAIKSVSFQAEHFKKLNLPNLQSLSLHYLKEDDFDFLSHFPNLTTLSIKNCPYLSDLSFLHKLPKLTTFRFDLRHKDFYEELLGQLTSIKKTHPSLQTIVLPKEIQKEKYLQEELKQAKAQYQSSPDDCILF